MRRAHPLLLPAVAAALVAAAASDARAQGTQTVVAKALYDQAVVAMGHKDYEAAYPLLEEAIRLEPAALGARLALAECYEAGDRLASARGMYGIVEQEAIKAKQTERQSTARERGAALEPRLAHLVIEVPGMVSTLPGLAIERDGVPVGHAQWGVSLPVDRGSHVIAIEALGRQRVVDTFEVLANGVIAKAIVPEPPPLSAGAPWWEVQPPPPAPRRLHRRLPELRPLPPPPVRGMLTLNLDAPGGLGLCELAPAGGVTRCAGTGASIDARAGQAFVLSGEDFIDSERFRLDDQTGSVTLHAAPARRSLRTISVVLMALGGAAALGCGVGVPVSLQSGS
jgi:hypothetical protein